MSHPKALSKTDMLCCVFQGKARMSDMHEGLVSLLCACMACYWLTYWDQQKSFRTGPLLCVCVWILHLKKALSNDNTWEPYKTWMWVVWNVFCFIEITFTTLMALKDYSEVISFMYMMVQTCHVYESVIALKCMMKWIFFSRCLNYFFFCFKDDILMLFWGRHGKGLMKLAVLPTSGFIDLILIFGHWNFISLSKLIETVYSGRHVLILNCCKTHTLSPN